MQLSPSSRLEDNCHFNSRTHVECDGISLTLMAVTASSFQVSLIPHTGMQTTLLQRHPGALVNLECDILGKYVEKLMRPAAADSSDSDLLALLS